MTQEANAEKKEGYDPSLPLRDFGSLTVEKYIEERLNNQLAYYDKTANKAKRRYLRSRSTSVVAAALVPVLVNLEFPYVDAITTILSVMVVLIVSLEGVFHFREQWVNSRSTSEALRKEYFQFMSAEGRYSELQDDKTKAFRIFVGRAEAMIETENMSTLQVMTRESQNEAKDNSVPARNLPENGNLPNAT